MAGEWGVGDLGSQVSRLIDVAAMDAEARELLEAQRTRMLAELGRLRHGKRALAGYAMGPGRATGFPDQRREGTVPGEDEMFNGIETVGAGPAEGGGAPSMEAPPFPMGGARIVQRTPPASVLSGAIDNVGLLFEVDGASRDLIIKIIDRDSKRIIRGVPPAEAQRRRSIIMHEILGVMFDRRGYVDAMPEITLFGWLHNLRRRGVAAARTAAPIEATSSGWPAAAQATRDRVESPPQSRELAVRACVRNAVLVELRQCAGAPLRSEDDPDGL
jgi:hypothetical protein